MSLPEEVVIIDAAGDMHKGRLSKASVRQIHENIAEAPIGKFHGTIYTQKSGDKDECVCCVGEHIFSTGITFEEEMQHGLASAITSLFDKHTMNGKRIVISIKEFES